MLLEATTRMECCCYTGDEVCSTAAAADFPRLWGMHGIEVNAKETHASHGRRINCSSTVSSQGLRCVM